MQTWTKSPRGFLRPPFSGTLTTVPSSIFSNACCTPSPETSLVMLGFSPFFAILSISSIYTIPVCAAATSNFAATSSLYRMDSTSSPTYPACVNVVASAMAIGTLMRRASVLASSVFPDPVGPMIRTLLLSNSTPESNIGNCSVSLSLKSLELR